MAGGEQLKPQCETIPFSTAALCGYGEDGSRKSLFAYERKDGQDVWKLFGVQIMGGTKLDEICK